MDKHRKIILIVLALACILVWGIVAFGIQTRNQNAINDVRTQATVRAIEARYR
jgi:hypothetical protein